MNPVSPPKVSIVMPVYNAAVYVQEAIQSILNQTFLNWELIVVDDGSTDETRSLVSAFDDPRIRLLPIAHCGLLGKVRNTGIASATGDYIAFLDGDDIYEAEALSVLSEHLDRHPTCTMTYGLFGLIDQNGQPLDRQPFGVYWIHAAQRFHVTTLVEHTWLNVLSSKVPNQFQGLMVRRSVLQEIGPLSEDPAFGTFHDFQYVLRLFQHHFSTIEGIPTVVFRYRQHPVSETYHPSKFQQNVSATKAVCDWFFEQAPPLQPEILACRALATAQQYKHRARAAWRAGSVQGVLMVLIAIKNDPAVTPSSMVLATFHTLKSVLRSCLCLFQANRIRTSFSGSLQAG